MIAFTYEISQIAKPPSLNAYTFCWLMDVMRTPTLGRKN